MTVTLGTALVQSATVYVDRYGIPRADDVAIVGDDVPAAGSSSPLTVGSLSFVGVVETSGSFGGQSVASWVGGVGGWERALPARPYHDDHGIMLSAVLGDLERDAATAAGRSPLGTVLEVPDVRIDVAGSWIRPSAVGRSLLDALAVAAGQPRGAWWVASDGRTHLGPRPAPSVSLPLLTVDPFDPALLRGVVRVADDGIVALLPGATLTASGLPAPLQIAAVVIHVGGEDIAVELWGEASEAELFARSVRHVMDPTVAYLGAQPYTVAGGPDAGLRVPVATPTGAAFPDAPLLDHAPGVPGVTCELDVGAAVLVSCVGGNPGAPVITGYPAGVLPIKVIMSASEAVFVGGSVGAHPVVVDNGLTAWLQAVRTGITSGGGADPGPPPTIAATKAKAV